MESFAVPKGQKQRVLMYLENYGSITDEDARRVFGIKRLAAVVFDLKDELKETEFTVETKMERGVNRFGEPTRYARYFLRRRD